MNGRSDRPTVCLTFDNMGRAADVGEGKATGPDPDEPGLRVGYPRLLDLLDRLELRATFFVEGWNGRHHPDRVAELAGRGHEVGLHGWVHEGDWAERPAPEVAELLERGTTALRDAGVDPIGFRAPGGDRGAHTAARLAELGYRLDASLADDPAPAVLPEGIAAIPFEWPAVDGYYYLGLHADDPEAHRYLLEAWDGLLDRLVADGGNLTLVAHAFLSCVDDDRFAALEQVLGRVAAQPDLEPVTAGQLASRLLAPPALGTENDA